MALASTQTQLRANIDALIMQQVPVVAKVANSILSIHAIDDSIVYGILLRKPHRFMDFIKVQLGYAHVHAPKPDLVGAVCDIATVQGELKDICKFLHVHLLRANLAQNPCYSWLVLASDPVAGVLLPFQLAFKEALAPHEPDVVHHVLGLAGDDQQRLLPYEFLSLCRGLLKGTRHPLLHRRSLFHDNEDDDNATNKARLILSRALRPHFCHEQPQAPFTTEVARMFYRSPEYEQSFLTAPPESWKPYTDEDLEYWEQVPPPVQGIVYLLLSGRSFSAPDSRLDKTQLVDLAGAVWSNAGFHGPDRLLALYRKLQPSPSDASSISQIEKAVDAAQGEEWRRLDLEFTYIWAHYLRPTHPAASAAVEPQESQVQEDEGAVSTAYENSLVLVKYWNRTVRREAHTIVLQRWPEMPTEELEVLLSEGFARDAAGANATGPGDQHASAAAGEYSRRMSTVSSTSGEGIDRCVLCYEKYAEREVEGDESEIQVEVARRLSCGHVFGSQCLRKTETKTCPVCRAPYSDD